MSEKGFTALDHILFAVRDLGEWEERWGKLLGLEASWRGMHPGMGTANVLYRVDNTYVELIGLTGEGGVFAQDVEKHISERGEGPYGLSFGAGDIEAHAEAMRDGGLDVPAVIKAHGMERDTGARRDWRMARFSGEGARGMFFILITHDSPKEALPRAKATAGSASVSRVDHVVLRTGDMEGAKGFYGEGGFGLRLALDKTFPQWGGRMLFFRVGGATVEVVESGGVGKGVDELWGMCWGVDDVDGAWERLKSQGADVSAVKAGRKEGTRVFTVKGEACGGTPTLFIGE